MATSPASTPTSERSHRVHWFAGRVGEVLDEVVGVEGEAQLALGVLDADETAETVLELRRTVRRLQGLEAAVLAHADTVEVGLAGAAGTSVCPSTAGWLRQATTTPGPVASRTVKDALALSERYAETAAAFRAGVVDAEQVHVIVRAVDALPAELDPELRREAEIHLLGLARTHPADELRALAKHLLEVVDPEAAEALLAKRLAKEEADAEAAASVWMRKDGRGRARGGFRLPEFHGDLFAAFLDRFANPTRAGAGPDDSDDPGGDRVEDGSVREDPTRPGGRVSRDRAWGRAFCELLEAVPADVLPSQGGTAVAVVVTMGLQTLTGGLAAAGVDTGCLVSPGQARRLAARHGVVPAVLGSGSCVLDLGRRARLFSPAQRVALRVRHRTCTADGCTIPAAWCQAHHKQPWQPRAPGRRGGRTDLDNATLLCGRHHRLVDRPGYDTSYRDDGTTVITRIRR